MSPSPKGGADPDLAVFLLRKTNRVEENTAADRLELSAEQIGRLDQLTPAAGERHSEAGMAAIDR